MTRLVSLPLRDVVLVRNEVDVLVARLQTSGLAPIDTSRLIDRLRDNVDRLGGVYFSEVRRIYVG